MRLEPGATIEELQLHEKGTTLDLAARFLHQLAACLHRAAGSQQVIEQQHTRAGMHPIGMHLQLSAAIFQIIFQGIGSVGKFAGLPQRDERLAHLQRERGGKQEPAGLGSGDRIDRAILVTFVELIDGMLERCWLSEQRSNILEENSRLGKVGNITNVLGKVHALISLTSWTWEAYDLEESETTMPVQIRAATLDDAAIIAEYNRRLAWETEHKTLDPDVVLRGVTQALLDPLRKGPYHVAVVDGQVIGQIQFTFEWSDWRAGWFWWIQSVYVHADHRGKGAFRALYQHVYDQARQDPEVIGIRLYVEVDNLAAQQTYRKLGMERIDFHIYQRWPL